MTKEEQIAELYLKKMNLKDVVFKPHGSMPPDFSLDNNIAVEVLGMKTNKVQGEKYDQPGNTKDVKWSLDEFVGNFNCCIEEETNKVRDFRKNYSSWWLILVDIISHKFAGSEKEKVKSMLRMNESWNRVIVIDSITGKRILEIAKIFEL